MTDHTPPDDRGDRSPATPGRGGALSVALLVTLAVQNAVPPFSTDMYSPAFPHVTEDLGTTASLVGLTLTAFFIGMGLGQILGGVVSDQLGRRRPLIIGGLVCTAGAVICALAPGIWVLIAGRLLQGLGGGVAAAVGRAVLVDLAHGNVLARTMSLLQALGGLAPMIAPVVGGVMVTRWPWQAVFWALSAFGVAMSGLAWRYVPESLPVGSRHSGGATQIVRGIGQVLRIRAFNGFMLTSAFSGFCMFGYIANASYVLQEQKGLTPLAFSMVFAANALLNIMCTLANARLIGWRSPEALIRMGLTISGSSVVLLVVTVTVWDTALVPLCLGFAGLMAAQAFIFGNSSAVGLGLARGNAGAASAIQGLVQSTASAVSAPLATMGGGSTAVPMVVVMVVGVAGAWGSFQFLARRASGHEGGRLPA